MRHPDEGTIHAWLDGALPDEEARALEAHAAGCPSCAAAVADARGMVAGASRILAALDTAPGGITPSRSGAPRTGARRAAWWRRPGIGIAAAMAIVAVGSTWAVTRDWAGQASVRQETTAPVELRTLDSAAPMMPAAHDTTPAPLARAAEDAMPDPARQTAGAAAGGVAGGAARRDTTVQALIPREPVSAAAERIEASASTLLQSRERAAVTAGAGRSAQAKAETETANRARTTIAGVVIVDSPPPPAPAAPLPSAGGAEVRRQAADIAAGAGVGGARATAAVEGCYAVELVEGDRNAGPGLPGLVRLTGPESRSLRVRPVPAERAEAGSAPLLVGPARDSASLGWRMAGLDSVSVRLADGGRTIIVTFPQGADEVRIGDATAAAAQGLGAWRAPVRIRRVPCPTR